MSKNRFLIHTRKCRQCGLPFSTTNSVAVVHPECRIEYYRVKAKMYQSMKGRNRPDARLRKKYFVNEKACEACGNIELTKVKKFFHADLVDASADPSVAGKDATQPHILCPTCEVKCKVGLMEPLSWKPIA